MLDINCFDQLHISLATSDDARTWSHDEVKKPETTSYRTLKPERDGLFCERILSPTHDQECACGKYKCPRFKGIVRERCGVEVTRSKVHHERMGYIELAAPVTHIWYFKDVPSRLEYLLDIALKDLEKVVYFAAYMVTSVDEETCRQGLPLLQSEYELERTVIEKALVIDLENRRRKFETDLLEAEHESQKTEVKSHIKRAAEADLIRIRKRAEADVLRLDAVWERLSKLKVGGLEGDEDLYRETESCYSDYFETFHGAEAIKRRLETFDLEGERDLPVEAIESGTAQRKARAFERIKMASALLHSGMKPTAMVLDAPPVIPPDLRPMVQLDGGRLAISDLNGLYRCVIGRNNHLKRMFDLGASEIMVNNEKRMLQEAIDALFDSGHRDRPVQGAGNRPLKSLSDMFKGKQGRLRQNLLSKRVDYSGRSVIVVGPDLKLHQYGLPTIMVLELLKPFVQRRLADLDTAENIKAAKRLVDRQRPEAQDVLEEIIKEHPVLLNRTPTLHRLGIQAFESQLIEGKAIRLHPLVCTAFNADFDGDQMAAYLSLSVGAQAEARILMLSSNNILRPSDGRSVMVLSQDMIIGLFRLSPIREGLTGEGRSFSLMAEARMVYDLGKPRLNAKCKIRFEGDVVSPADWSTPEGWQAGDPIVLETSLGRMTFNETFPVNFPYVNEAVDKRAPGRIVNVLAERHEKMAVGTSLDALKAVGFYWTGRSGATIVVSDVVTLGTKAEILDEAEKAALRIEHQLLTGRIEDEDRRRNLADLWSAATDQIVKEMCSNFDEVNTANRIVPSGARGDWEQVRQIAGMRGLVADPKGLIISRPIKLNYCGGLSVLEYFIATHGACKGLADIAFRTTDSGHLMRRLVDVSQDIIVRERDCGTRRGLPKAIVHADSEGVFVPDEQPDTTVYARTLICDTSDAEGSVIVPVGVDLDDVVIEKLIAAGIMDVSVRLVLTCESHIDTCAMCYGRSMATGEFVDIGEVVGIVAAQFTGEPGTQLTIRMLHTGDSASADDIAQGFPRVQELFKACTPKGEAPIAESVGHLKVGDGERTRRLIVVRDDGDDDLVYQMSKRAKSLVPEEGRASVDRQFIEGSVDPKKVLRISGRRAAQEYIVSEVQSVYRSQGVEIHDKHIEVIVRQMLRRVIILKAGTMKFLPGELMDASIFEDGNRAAMPEGGKSASGRPELMGTIKASPVTDSWSSIASFQETTKVLIEVTLNSKSDPLSGLRGNITLGKLIPARTGLEQLCFTRVESTPEVRVELEKNNGFSRRDLEVFDGGFEYNDFPDFDLSSGYTAF